LGLFTISKTDPAFAGGMKADASALSDVTADVEAFANSKPIHGLLKVAGSSPVTVHNLLEKIKKALQAIEDVPGGRIEGAMRDGANRGKEQ